MHWIKSNVKPATNKEVIALIRSKIGFTTLSFAKVDINGNWDKDVQYWIHCPQIPKDV